MTSYLGVSGEGKVFVPPKADLPQRDTPLGTRMADIRDGTSNTIAVVEASDAAAVVWTKPDDYQPNDEDPLKGLVGLRPGGFTALICDGSVRFISASIDREVLKGMFTTSGGERVTLP